MDMDEFDNDIDWEDGPPDDGSFGPPFQPPPRSERYNRYNNAYGDYRGGYSPLGFGNSGPGFGPMGQMPGPPRPGPPFMFGRGFGPNGPPQRSSFKDDRHIRYLIRCGVPAEHVRIYPKDMLHLIQPENCGVCALNFNSFSSSRVHYTSKNHQKSVKKYLSQRSSIGQSRQQGFAEAVPLKARELYCELCDVHITSKSHADSHYSGKNHHAIVEGRKQTKNPVLLQRNMADRIDQLIRREKKHLKAMEKKEEDKPKAPSAPPDPELYCEICKTSVTCSDQMTMHLNGKKHLAKEKRHIFEKIKANPDNNEEQEYYEDDEGEEGDAGEGDAEEAGAGDSAGGDQPAQDGGNGEWPDGEYDI